MVNIYAFDVDDTLWLSNGPVQLQQLIYLKNQGHILGLCGAWQKVVNSLDGWQNLFSFVGGETSEIGKVMILKQLKDSTRVDRYIMVGNFGYGGQSKDKEQAEQAGWEFIQEKDFKEGL